MNCRSCGKEIVFLRTEKDRRIPVNAETVEKGEYVFNKEKHISHFADCPEASKFRNKKVKNV